MREVQGLWAKWFRVAMVILARWAVLLQAYTCLHTQHREYVQLDLQPPMIPKAFSDKHLNPNEELPRPGSHSHNKSLAPKPDALNPFYM